MWENVAPLMIFLISAESNENVLARSSSRWPGFPVHIPYFQEDINCPSTCLYLKISLRFSCSTNSNWILLSWDWWLMLRCSELFCFLIVFLHIRGFVAKRELILAILIKLALNLLELLSSLPNWDTEESEKSRWGKKNHVRTCVL